MTSTEESRKALDENIKAAKEEAKAEQEARLEKARQEAAEKNAEMLTGTEEYSNKNNDPIDIVEISPESVAALQNEQAANDTDTSTETAKQSVPHNERAVDVKHVKTSTQTSHARLDTSENVKSEQVKLDIKV